MKKLTRNIIIIGAVVILILSNFPLGISGNMITRGETDSIIVDIQMTKDKTLVFNGTIGCKEVKYWTHIINNITVIGDSILLHVDPETGKILDYLRTWSDVSEIFSQCETICNYEPSNYVWKRMILYPNEDCSNFYPLYDHIEYPLVCLEVRYENGSTYIYNTNEIKIGYEVPAPSVNGFTLSGDGNDGTGDYWVEWRVSATDWFSKWCDSVEFQIFPLATEVSDYVTSPDVKFFYEVAHGGSFQFQCGQESDTDKFYSSINHCQKDMAKRERMNFAFLGSCDGMTIVDNGTLSYELRKGNMLGTVTIGYTHMTEYPGSFSDTLHWQYHMFSSMDNGWTIKQSFDEACSYHPSLIGYVVFVGDETLKVRDNPPCIPETPRGDTSIKINALTEYTTTAFEPDEDDTYFMFDWDDGSNSGWLGPYSAGENCLISHSWDEAGDYDITAKVKDADGLESTAWSSSLSVHVITENTPPNTPIITGAGTGKVGINTSYNFMSMDPEGDQIYYFIDWGDNTSMSWWGPFSSRYEITTSHAWTTKGTYTMKAKAKDIYDDESDWATFTVIMPYTYDQSISLFLELVFQRFPHAFPVLRSQFRY